MPGALLDEQMTWNRSNEELEYAVIGPSNVAVNEEITLPADTTYSFRFFGFTHTLADGLDDIVGLDDYITFYRKWSYGGEDFTTVVRKINLTGTKSTIVDTIDISLGSVIFRAGDKILVEYGNVDNKMHVIELFVQKTPITL